MLNSDEDCAPQAVRLAVPEHRSTFFKSWSVVLYPGLVLLQYSKHNLQLRTTYDTVTLKDF